jgi:NAD(P)-dependent dehydrogenase (short-subunit alcohol dehydrogenase family)
MTIDDLFRLDGKTAVVTGAGGGFGFEFAAVLAQAGADVVCLDRDGAAAERTAESVRGGGRRALALACDVSSEREVERAFARIADEFDSLDILMNNAGVADRQPLRVHECATEDWMRVIDVDLHGVFFCARAALRAMLPRGSGKIVNVASMWGLAGASSIMPVPAYNAAKGAVVNLTRELGLEYARDGIQVNALCPGFYRTRISDGAFDDPGFLAATTGFAPIGRVAEPEEIRGPALFLASSASDYMIGQTLVVDGGCLAK